MKAKILKSGQILRAHMPYFRRPSHILSNLLNLCTCKQNGRYTQLRIHMSQNKIAAHVRGLCTGNHWKRYSGSIYKIEKGPR